jgi:membrane-associated HD superfamily phosphohydrolase
MKVFLIISLFISLSSLSLPTEVKATAEETVGFSVQPELPENQIDNNVSYFDLRVEPEQEQALNVTIYNHSTEEMTIETSVHNASTNSNGLIVYEEQDTIDSSLENPITELVTLENDTVTISAGDSEVITATLNTPEAPFEGIKLGGLHFEKVPGEAEEETEGVTIQNRYAYVIGLQISESDEEVSPELLLQSITPTLVNYRTAVVTELQNSQPRLMNDVTVNAKVYEKNNSEVIRDVTQEEINMAPNSTMDFVIDWDNRPLEAGDYQLHLTATAGEETWEWEEEFVIEEETEVLNEDAVELEDSNNNWVIYISILLLLILIILILLIYIRRMKSK